MWRLCGGWRGQTHGFLKSDWWKPMTLDLQPEWSGPKLHQNLCTHHNQKFCEQRNQKLCKHHKQKFCEHQNQKLYERQIKNLCEHQDMSTRSEAPCQNLCEHHIRTFGIHTSGPPVQTHSNLCYKHIRTTFTEALCERRIPTEVAYPRVSSMDKVHCAIYR